MEFYAESFAGMGVSEDGESAPPKIYDDDLDKLRMTADDHAVMTAVGAANYERVRAKLKQQELLMKLGMAALGVAVVGWFIGRRKKG